MGREKRWGSVERTACTAAAQRAVALRRRRGARNFQRAGLQGSDTISACHASRRLLQDSNNVITCSSAPVQQGAGRRPAPRSRRPRHRSSRAPGCTPPSSPLETCFAIYKVSILLLDDLRSRSKSARRCLALLNSRSCFPCSSLLCPFSSRYMDTKQALDQERQDVVFAHCMKSGYRKAEKQCADRVQRRARVGRVRVRGARRAQSAQRSFVLGR